MRHDETVIFNEPESGETHGTLREPGNKVTVSSQAPGMLQSGGPALTSFIAFHGGEGTACAWVTRLLSRTEDELGRFGVHPLIQSGRRCLS